ncbi:MAG: plastocyanin/azurin family copper-binding protein [Chloroflexota bacterium]
MFVFQLPGLTWRSCAALLLGLAILIGQPRDVLAADVQVSIVQPGDTLTLRYDPSSLSIVAGSTVTWTNNGSMPITITSPDGLFDSETVAPGASFSHAFDTPGTFRYFCVPYPHMKGVIEVTAP